MGQCISENYVSGSQNNAPPQESKDSNETSYEQLRNEWTIGSKCIVFSSVFEQWIETNMEIKHEKGKHILAVNNEHDKHISLERFSNNIQPIYISNSNNNN
eukprot:539207_1